MKKAWIMMKSTDHYYPRGNVGFKFNEQQLKNLSEAHKGQQWTNSQREFMKKLHSGKGHPQYGKPKPLSVREKISRTLLENHPMRGKKQITSECPHCHKVGGHPNMVRWHFDNCKFIK